MIKLWWKLVRYGFRLLYYELAWTYDLVSWSVSLGNWRQWQRVAIPLLFANSMDKVLELAHGTADLQIDLCAAGIYSIGLDLSPYMGKIAYSKLVKRKLTPRLVRGSAMHLPFPEATFKAVVVTFPTEFVIHPDTLLEARRVLTPGGRLVAVLNGMLTFANPLVWFLEWLYQITGQRGPLRVEPVAAFGAAGFKAEMRTETLRRSRVWVVIAEKPRQR